MHAPYDRSRKSSHRSESRGGTAFLILPVIVTIVLITLAIIHPKSAMWISQSVQAEFGGYGIANDMPVETAQPLDMMMPLRTVHAD